MKMEDNTKQTFFSRLMRRRNTEQVPQSEGSAAPEEPAASEAVPAQENLTVQENSAAPATVVPEDRLAQEKAALGAIEPETSAGQEESAASEATTPEAIAPEEPAAPEDPTGQGEEPAPDESAAPEEAETQENQPAAEELQFSWSLNTEPEKPEEIEFDWSLGDGGRKKTASEEPAPQTSTQGSGMTAAQGSAQNAQHGRLEQTGQSGQPGQNGPSAQPAQLTQNMQTPVPQAPGQKSDEELVLETMAAVASVMDKVADPDLEVVMEVVKTGADSEAGNDKENSEVGETGGMKGSGKNGRAKNRRAFGAAKSAAAGDSNSGSSCNGANGSGGAAGGRSNGSGAAGAGPAAKLTAGKKFVNWMNGKPAVKAADSDKNKNAEGGKKKGRFRRAIAFEWAPAPIRWFLFLVGHILFLAVPAAQLLVLEYYNYMGDWKVFEEHLELHPDTFQFEIIVMYVLYFTLLFLIRRPWAVTFVMTVATLACSYINYMKLLLNGDPFLPGDITLIGGTGDLLDFSEGVEAPPEFLLVAAAAVGVLLVLYLFSQVTRIRNRWVLIVGLLMAALIGTYMTDYSRSSKMLANHGMSFVDADLQTSNYIANGFVGGFTINTLLIHTPRMEGYSKEAIDEILAPYEAEIEAEAAAENEAADGGQTAQGDSPAAANAGAVIASAGSDKTAGTDAKAGSEADAKGADDPAPLPENPDVILVLNESFTDVHEIEQLEYVGIPLKNYDEMIRMKNCISGKLYTSAYLGGTVKPEFEILSGLPLNGRSTGVQPYSHIKGDIDTFVSNYKNNGYHTVALHTFNKKFYNRSNVYENLGFEEFYGDSDLQHLGGDIAWTSQKRISDLTMAGMITDFVDDSEDPCFLFAITMGNHQPYLKIENKNKIQVVTSCKDENLSDEDLVKVNTYVNNLYDADQMLGALRNYVDNRKKPTVLIFFGDHKPNLGSTYSALHTFAKADGTGEDSKLKYSTPFIMYANYELNTKDGLLKYGNSNEISTYYLMEAVARATGMQETPYMRKLADAFYSVPYFNAQISDQVILNEDQEEQIRQIRMISYDRMGGKNYSAGR